jgi:hypothetical protein
MGCACVGYGGIAGLALGYSIELLSGLIQRRLRHSP